MTVEQKIEQGRYEVSYKNAGAVASQWIFENRVDLGLEDQRELQCMLGLVEDLFVPLEELPSYGVELPPIVLDFCRACLASQ